MSDETVLLVRSALDAWNRGDIPAFADHASEDVVWLEIAGLPESDGHELHGRERMRDSLTSLFEIWESYRLEVEEVQDVGGDRVLALAREVARGRASGVEVNGRWAYLITVNDGEIVRIEAYREPADALRAAGIPDPSA